MNRNHFHFHGPVKILLAAILALGAGKAAAQIAANDDASAYTTWTNGMNLGYGFTPWTLTQNNGGGNAAGFFIGSSGGIDVSNNSFGLYANTTNLVNSAYAIAYRGFSNALTTNQVFKVKFQNTAIASGGVMGFCLRNNNVTNFAGFNSSSPLSAAINTESGTRFAFYFIGGYNDYYIWDGNNSTDTGIGWTSAGLSLEFYPMAGDTYLLIVKSADGSSTIASFSNQPLAGGGGTPIITFAGFNSESGAYQDAYFNSFQVSSVTLIPPGIIGLSPVNGTVYWPPASGLSVSVTSLFSTVSSNNIQLTLNGVVQTGSSWTVLGSGTASNHVVLNSALQGNTVYTGTITATDANGNHTTNNFTFNTWLTSPYNLYIESGDYNFESGLWIDNFVAQSPNQAYQDTVPADGGGLFGSNNIDYLEDDLTGTNHPNYYRTNDLPQIELATDVDHDSFASYSYQDYDLGYIENGEWVDYTRRMSNLTYIVYARMAGFPQQGGNTTMLMERAASPTVSSTNQPRASMGTFVCPSTGGFQNWAFVPLTDFFANQVQVRLPGTNTFRLTCLGPSGSYNFNYLLLVATTNTATLRPYVASGYPYPNAGGVGPDQLISFIIANRQTSVSSVQLFLNTSNVTSGIVLSNNTAGTVVSYQPPTLLSAGTNSLQVIFSDGAVSQTNTWQFTVATLTVIPPAYALTLNANYASGFAEQIAKAQDSATNIDFPDTVARALAQLAGTLTNSQTGQPYTNMAAGPNGNGTYTETNTINYDITGRASGAWTFATKTNFPYVPANGTNNYIALAASMYLQLTQGVYTFAVRSDDGFELTAGPTPANTNVLLGIFDAGRPNYVATTFDFIVQTNGLYPMRLVYDQGLFGGSVEFYSINRTNGTATLINDPATPGSIKAYRLVSVVPIPVAIQNAGNKVVLTWSDASWSLQSAPLVTGTYTTINGSTSPYTNAISGTQEYFRLVHP